MNGKTLIKLSGGLIALGISILFFPLAMIGYSKHMSHTLLDEAESYFSEETSSPQEPVSVDTVNRDKKDFFNEANSTMDVYQKGLYPEPASELTLRPQKGEIIGILSIPSLGIKEAILEGTGQEELAKAPGHLPDSVFPGQIGTSIIAAHNATTFRHLDQLKEGMEFTITTEQGVFTFSVTGQRILDVNDSLQDMAYPAIALETCYPLNAKQLTNKRLFVESALIKSDLLK